MLPKEFVCLFFVWAALLKLSTAKTRRTRQIEDAEVLIRLSKLETKLIEENLKLWSAVRSIQLGLTAEKENHLYLDEMALIFKTTLNENKERTGRLEKRISIWEQTCSCQLKKKGGTMSPTSVVTTMSEIPVSTKSNPNQSINQSTFTTDKPSTVSPISGENVALHKYAWQSSEFVPPGHFLASPAEKAVDGNSDSNFTSGKTCTHTNVSDTSAWWTVDLGKSYIIQQVEITNRKDAAPQRLHNFNIRILKDFDVAKGESTQADVCYHLPGHQQAKPAVMYNCNTPIIGRYVKIELLDPGILSLCEVKVFQYKTEGENIALHKEASQSSEFFPPGHLRASPAGRAVDGNTDPHFTSGKTCTHTNVSDKSAWWTVDLGKLYLIRQVEITNRKDSAPQRLHNFNIRVLKDFDVAKGESTQIDVCYHLPGHQQAEPAVMYNCNTPIIGRYVKIELLDPGILTLCEVKVFGEDATKNK